jgi:SAM-dependent methyltransferase
MSAPEPNDPRGTAAASWQQAVASLLADPAQAVMARDCYFDGTSVEAGERYWASAEWRAARQLLPATVGRVLDLGAGRGIASYALARDGWQVCALEPDPSELVGAAAIQGPGACDWLPYRGLGSFRRAAALPERSLRADSRAPGAAPRPRSGAVLLELYRVLRPGGRLVALRDHAISRAGDLARFQQLHPLHRLYGGEHAYLLEQYTAAITDGRLLI